MTLARLLWIPFLAAFGLGCAEPEPAAVEPELVSAADYRSGTVDTALEAAMRAARTRGYSATGVPFRGFAVEQAASVEELTLERGSCYALISAASGGVRNLDLELFDADGREAAHDVTSGPSSALVFCPVASGTFYAVVRATAGSGLFGVRLFRGPTGLDVSPSDLIQLPSESAP